MAKGRFGAAGSSDAYPMPWTCTVFHGPFVVAAPDSGWVNGGISFSRAMVGHAQNVGGLDAPHLRTQDAYLASLAPFVGSAVAEIPADESGTREVLEATRAFIELNE